MLIVHQHVHTRHSQYEQVEKDVERSMWKFTRLNSDLERQYKRKQLSRLMNSILSQEFVDGNFFKSTSTLKLHYFQGFHDICTIVLLACGEDTGALVCSKLVQYQLFDVMKAPSLDPMLKVLKLIVPLIRCVDAQLAKFITKADNEEGQFALSWVLTWFSHVIEDFDKCARLFDFFLASHPLMPMYFATALILKTRDAVLSVECEFSMVYKTLRELPESKPHPHVDEYVTTSSSSSSGETVTTKTKQVHHHQRVSIHYPLKI